jgi:hypothetical protein
VSGAFVAATGPSGDDATTTGSGGAFSLDVPTGTYRLSANAQGYAAALDDGVDVTGPTSEDLSLTRSQSPLTSVPVYGGAKQVVADGEPGVFYAAGGNAGGLYRTTNWGGTWTPVTDIADDSAFGLPHPTYPELLTTSGRPGEVAVMVGNGTVLFSTNFGVSWQVVANPPNDPNSDAGSQLLWGHVGGTSVLMYIEAEPFAEYVADMNAADPGFEQMTRPYESAGQPVVVADGSDKPWFATVDPSGTASIFPLTRATRAPAPSVTVPGFTSQPLGPETIGLGGESAAGEPPSALVVAGFGGGAMTVKAAAADRYPKPSFVGLNCPVPNNELLTEFGSYSPVTPNSSASYGAAWTQGCWVQDVSGEVSASPATGQDAAIDAGYNATASSPGSDAVVMIAPGANIPSEENGSLEVAKLADSQDGVPTPPSDPTAQARAGPGSDSGGVETNGITAATVHQTAFGPDVSDVVSATDVGGAASDDGAATFEPAIDQEAWSAAWWRGATADWMLFGLGAYAGNPDMLGGFENWSPSTSPLDAGNVSGSTPQDLQAPFAPIATPVIDSIAGVPGQDSAFVDATVSEGGYCTCAEGAVDLLTLATGPAVTSATPIGKGVITKAGPIAYCSATGSANSLADVLLVVADDSVDGALYRVTDATGANPVVTKVVDLPAYSYGSGSPALDVDCASGTVVAASGGAGADLLLSHDGGEGFDSVPFTDPGGAAATIRAATFVPGPPAAILVGDAAGYIQRSTDGGQTWTVVNDPTTGLNLSAAASLSGGLWDLVGWPAAGGAARDSLDAAADPFAGSNLVAGPGEYAGTLTAAASRSTVPVISRFILTHSRFAAERKHATAVIARKQRAPRGTTFKYTVSEPGFVGLFITAKLPGRISGRRCVAATKHNARHRRCKIPTFYELIRHARSGPHSLSFTGRIGRHVLAPGSYTATIASQTPNGQRSATRSLRFTIVPES